MRIATVTTAPERPSAAEQRYYDLIPTPLGSIAVAVDGDGCLIEIRLDGQPRGGVRAAQACAAARRQLDEYFAGARREFTLELRPHGTAFQQRVWRALQAIPFGTLRNYGDIARAIGQPNATRAVGQANGRNPLPIIVPCHRVIASNGTIGGYTGGLGIKQRLLALEGIGLDLE